MLHDRVGMTFAPSSKFPACHDHDDCESVSACFSARSALIPILSDDSQVPSS